MVIKPVFIFAVFHYSMYDDLSSKIVKIINNKNFKLILENLIN